MIYTKQVQRALRQIMDNHYSGYPTVSSYNDFRGMCSVMKSLWPDKEINLYKGNNRMAIFYFEYFRVIIKHHNDRNTFKICY